LKLSVVFISSPATPGNLLCVAITVIEGLDIRAAYARSLALTSRMRHLVNGIQVMALGVFLTAGVVLFFAAFGVLAMIGLDRLVSVAVGVIAALVILSLNTVWLVPVSAIALTMLYFRARQASGEEIAGISHRSSM
jgi:hypothetical protein